MSKQVSDTLDVRDRARLRRIPGARVRGVGGRGCEGPVVRARRRAASTSSTSARAGASTSRRAVEGAVYSYDALYEDIVADERIVYTYNMHRDGVRMSVSVTTVELLADGDGTHLRYTEQGVFLDGEDTPEQREHGTQELLDKLGEALAQGAAAV